MWCFFRNVLSKSMEVQSTKHCVDYSLTTCRKYQTIFFISCLLLLSMTQLTAPVSATQFIKDANGRTLILHGLNISEYAKYVPDYLSWHTFSDYERMKAEWGMNSIRLLIFWAAVEPQPGLYDDAYLDAVAERVLWAEQLGIHVIIDLHQDVYSGKYNGDGAPEWACWDDGVPFIPTSPWWTNYLSYPVRRAFTNLWTQEELISHYVATWGHIAERFTGNATVIGYDLFNEPSFGDIPIWEFESDYLYEFYLRCIEAIRAVDNQHLIFYEPEILTDFGIPSYIGVLPGDNLVYTPHYYDPTVHEGNPYSQNPTAMLNAISLRESEANVANVPLLFGEYGCSDIAQYFDVYLKDMLGIFDNKMIGWMFWSYDRGDDTSFSILDEDGNERNQLLYIVKPYATTIAGDPVRFSYNYEQRLFYVDFTQNNQITGTTEIFVGAHRIYPEGFIVACTDPPGTWSYTYDATFELVHVTTNPAVTNHRIVIAPDVTPISREIITETLEP